MKLKSLLVVLALTCALFGQSLGSPNSIYFNAALTAAATVKTTAGSISGVHLYNPNATTCFLQIFNVASGSVTLGTTVPILSLAVSNGPKDSNIPPALLNGLGSLQGSAISVASTTTATGASTCAVGMTVNLWYQ